jgi:hypothetical protein
MEKKERKGDEDRNAVIQKKERGMKKNNGRRNNSKTV